MLDSDKAARNQPPLSTVVNEMHLMRLAGILGVIRGFRCLLDQLWKSLRWFFVPLAVMKWMDNLCGKVIGGMEDQGGNEEMTMVAAARMIAGKLMRPVDAGALSARSLACHFLMRLT